MLPGKGRSIEALTELAVSVPVFWSRTTSETGSPAAIWAGSVEREAMLRSARPWSRAPIVSVCETSRAVGARVGDGQEEGVEAERGALVGGEDHVEGRVLAAQEGAEVVGARRLGRDGGGRGVDRDRDLVGPGEPVVPDIDADGDVVAGVDAVGDDLLDGQPGLLEEGELGVDVDGDGLADASSVGDLDPDLGEVDAVGGGGADEEGDGDGLAGADGADAGVVAGEDLDGPAAEPDALDVDGDVPAPGARDGAAVGAGQVPGLGEAPGGGGVPDGGRDRPEVAGLEDGGADGVVGDDDGGVLRGGRDGAGEQGEEAEGGKEPRQGRHIRRISGFSTVCWHTYSLR